jgi:molybdopterin-guanine dinucleotide biosynthesis protein A
MISDVTAVLLAGGRSRRMGRDKRFIEVDGEKLLDRSLRVLRANFEQVAIVIAHHGETLDAPVSVFRDLIPERGSLGGLYTGLKHAATPHVFLAACDMPFLNPSVIHFLVNLKEGVDVVMANLENGIQPTHAVYSQRCIPFIEDMLKGGHLRIQDLLNYPGIRFRLVETAELLDLDPRSLSFINVNTPDDLKLAQGLPSSISMAGDDQRT